MFYEMFIGALCELMMRNGRPLVPVIVVERYNQLAKFSRIFFCVLESFFGFMALA